MAFSFTPAQIKATKDAKASEWAKFKKRFPGADTSQFRTEADFDEKGKAWAGVVYITGDKTKEVFDLTRRTTSQC